MVGEEGNDLDRRLANLEREVGVLRDLVENLIENRSTTNLPDPNQSTSSKAAFSDDTPPMPPPGSAFSQKEAAPPRTFPQPPPTSPTASSAKSQGFTLPEHMRTSEYWLNKVGIGLVLFAVVFFFKYSIDKGWLTPTVRIIIGMAFGLVLKGVGLKIYSQRRHFSLVLLGGGTATLYITGFAAFQFFQLVSHLTALVFMVLVTAAAIGISLKQKEQVLSIIGATGGFATPFLLYTGQSNIPGLMIYTCVLVAGMAAIYFFRSWRSLLWLSMIFGWVIMILAHLDIVSPDAAHVMKDYWALQFGLIVCWISFGLVPLAREIVGQTKPDRYKYFLSEFARKRFSEGFKCSARQHASVLTISAPLIALTLSMSLWENFTNDHFWGWISMGLAGLYGLIALRLRKWPKLSVQTYIHMLLSFLFLTISFNLLLEDHALLFTLSSEALVLFIVARRFSDRVVAFSGHVLYIVVVTWLFDRLTGHSIAGAPLLSRQALTDLWVIATMFGVAYLTSLIVVRRIYFIAASLLLGLLMIREFDGNTLFVILTVMVVGYHYVSARIGDRVCVGFGHLFFAGIGVWLADRLMILHIINFPIDLGRPPLLNIDTLVDSTYLAAIVVVTRMLKNRDDRKLYFLGLHVAILALLLREFQGIENGQGFVSASWGLYASALLISGLRLDSLTTRRVALVTLMLVVGKLFIIDLANLETIWRILLFLGVGGAFLLLSYYFKSMWKAGTKEEEIA